MSRDAKRTITVGSGPLSLLGILFVGLKLTSYIDWSWWWVTAPFWAPLAVIATIFLVAVVAGVVAGVAAALVGVRLKKRTRVRK